MRKNRGQQSNIAKRILTLTLNFSGFKARWNLLQYELAGGSPAATFFSCLAKKRMQKKATAAPLTSPLS